MKQTLLYIALMAMPMMAGAQTKPGKHNLTVKEWKTDVKTNIKLLDHTTTYDSKGNKAEEIEYKGGKQKWRKKYERDSQGRITRELVYNEKNKLQSIRKFEYTTAGKKKTESYYNAQGKLQAIKTFEYLNQ